MFLKGVLFFCCCFSHNSELITCSSWLKYAALVFQEFVDVYSVSLPSLTYWHIEQLFSHCVFLLIAVRQIRTSSSHWLSLRVKEQSLWHHVFYNCPYSCPYADINNFDHLSSAAKECCRVLSAVTFLFSNVLVCFPIFVANGLQNSHAVTETHSQTD